MVGTSGLLTSFASMIVLPPPQTVKNNRLSDATWREQDKAPRLTGKIPGRRDAGSRVQLEKAVAVQRRVHIVRALDMTFNWADGQQLLHSALPTLPRETAIGGEAEA